MMYQIVNHFNEIPAGQYLSATGVVTRGHLFFSKYFLTLRKVYDIPGRCMHCCAKIRGNIRKKLKPEGLVRHKIKDDRLKVYGNRRVKNMLKSTSIQDLWAGVLQPANCMGSLKASRVGKNKTASGRAFYWTMPSRKKRNII